jgi:transposase InsO family protein
MVSEPSMASSNTQNHTGFSNTSFQTSSSSMQAPLLILSNMSNLMSVKLDSSNFIVWKHQLSSILKAYSMIDFVDGTIPSPSRFLTDAEGNLTSAANPEFKIWNTRDQALLTLINSTLSTPVLSMVVGHNSAQAVGKTLEQRFTSTSRANVLNLKIELHNLKKGGESVNSYLQKVKNTRDKLVAVGILIDNEELLHIILKGLPREYGPFCSAIRTRNEPVSFEEIMVLLQTEELSLVECSDSGKDLQAMALFASTPNNRNFNSQSSFYVNNSQSRGRGRNNSQRGRNGRFNNNNQYSSQSNPPNQGQSTFSQHSQTKPEGSRPQCQICGKLGHQALDCYHRMDFAYQGRHPPAKLAAMASTSNGAQAGESWLTDTGATDHLTANMTNLNTHMPYQGTDQVAVGNGQSIPINNIGTGQLCTKLYNFRLQNLLHSSKISSNLLSVHKLCKDNHCSCYFDSNKFLIQDLPSGKVLYKGLSENGLYPIHTNHPSVQTNTASPSVSAFLSSKNKWQLWHHRLGHPSDRVLVSALPNLSSCISVQNKHVQHHCKHCLIGKMHKLPFEPSKFQSTQPLELVHSDVWGPAPITSFNGYRYYILFVDDYTRFSWLYLLKNKSDVFTTFKNFKATVEKQLSKQIQFLRTDCGGEYTSNDFNAFCASNGITHHLSCPHTPQQNGIVERKHRHIVECALTLLSHASLPIVHWTYAITAAIHLINRLPTPTLSHKSPWETLFHKTPDISHLRTFGCICFPLLRPYNTHKLQPRSTPCIFLGYPTFSKGYVCLDPTTHIIYISRHVVFNETEFLPNLPSQSALCNTPVTSTFDSSPWLLVMLHTCSVQNSSTHPESIPSSPSLVTIPSLTAPIVELSPSFSSPTESYPPSAESPTLSAESAEPSTPSAESPTPVSPAQLTLVPAQPPPQPSVPSLVHTHPMQTRARNGIFKPKLYHTTLTDYTYTEPPTYQAASKYPPWCTAMNEEFSALQRQKTWSLIPLPPGKNIVGCKWVFKLKRNSDGSISRYKARLVAKGFHQQYGIDFAETFSPVVKPPTVRLILALAVTYNWPLKQLDVRNAFLHGILKEEVYMQQPTGYVDSTHPTHVCKLHKSIYGLKQAPRAWFESFTTQLLTLGFHPSSADSSLFIYKEGPIIAFLLLYVDDIVLTGNNPFFLQQLITSLSQVFELKDMGVLHYFLGLQITRSSQGLTLTQTKYATDLLTKHNMLNCSPCKTPCVPNTRLSATCGKPLTDVHAYRSLVGALHYLTFTRPDLLFAVHQVCQFMQAPTDIHLTAAKRILRYVRGTIDHGLFYTPGPISLSAFSDADWAGDPNDRRSTSGLLVFLGNNPITWSAKKQLTVSRSSTEAEYRALASASAELCWLCTLAKDLGLYLYDPPILWCDNVSALAIASNPVFHARTKHIEVDFHFIRERVLRKDLQVKFVSTVDQLADIFTKGLPSPRFQDLCSKLLVPVDSIRLRGDDEVNDTLVK